jgi:tetratricopeptide (TPR) repeat protein
VSSTPGELAEAERFLRRAVEFAPDWAEARLRLGRVLGLRERHVDATTELSRALVLTDEPTLRYFGALFLGDAEQALGHREPAQLAYEQALAQFPEAQSPHLALAQLARRYADRPMAIAAIERLFDRSGRAHLAFDPWWEYDAGTIAAYGELLRAVREAFLGEVGP